VERIGPAWQLEKTLLEKAEEKVEILGAALAAACSRMSVPVSPETVKAFRKSIKREDEDAGGHCPRLKIFLE
jgi:hypothetical protein